MATSFDRTQPIRRRGSRRHLRTALFGEQAEITKRNPSVLDRVLGRAQRRFGSGQALHEIGNTSGPGQRDPAASGTAPRRRTGGCEPDAADGAVRGDNTAAPGGPVRRAWRR
jgi:hypothetical protein